MGQKQDVSSSQVNGFHQKCYHCSQVQPRHVPSAEPDQEVAVAGVCSLVTALLGLTLPGVPQEQMPGAGGTVPCTCFQEMRVEQNPGRAVAKGTHAVVPPETMEPLLKTMDLYFVCAYLNNQNNEIDTRGKVCDQQHFMVSSL